ncbi:hypothetical protein BGX30_014150 [Mortierella sp. GBA39]|nr:hypothetical protein BGX30_014150 [Mortierella sp. GBA39]
MDSSNCLNCGSYTQHDPSASSTAQDLGKAFSLELSPKPTVSGAIPSTLGFERADVSKFAPFSPIGNPLQRFKKPSA